MAIQIRRALISVFDKTGVIDFARTLSTEFGVEIISTGGTAKALKENAIPVTLVEETTGFPELMDGRVKTLHPRVHAAILADRDNPSHMRQLAEHDIKPIDLVAVNLYPFSETTADPNCTFDSAIEMIDIGGPCMIRAAAKNHKHVLVVAEPKEYARILDMLRQEAAAEEWSKLRMDLAKQVFRKTSEYDSEVAGWLDVQTSDASSALAPIKLEHVRSLRYGENPHQRADITKLPIGEADEANLLVANGINAENLSFNNYVDTSAALELCKELSREFVSTSTSRDNNVCVFIKHTNACGVGMAASPVEAYRQAYLGDPNAAMGGILACNFAVDESFASAVMNTYADLGKNAGAGGFFVEVWVAPSFDEQAVQVIQSAKKWGGRVRLLSVGDMNAAPMEPASEYKGITGGMLVQSRDLAGLDEDGWQVATNRQPTEQELHDLRLAWLICKHTKSNAITLCKDGSLIGNGAGQMSRVMSCRIATWLAKENNHAKALEGCVAASDAFFPFPDGPNILIDSGVRAIIQPGGSKRDDDTINACNERDISMILTGTRHFKH